MATLKSIDDVVEVIKARFGTDRDIVIIVTGPRGEGKTTFSCQLAKAIDPNFSFARNLVFSSTAELIIQKIQNLPEYSAIVVDEAITSTYNREWQDDMNVALNKAMGRMRRFHKVLIFNIPRFTLIDSGIRNAWCDMWVDIPTRNRAMVIVKDKLLQKHDPWHLDRIDELIDEGKVKNNTDIDGYKTALLKLPRQMFKGEIPWHRFTKQEEEDYVEYRKTKEKLMDREMREGRGTRKTRQRFERLCWAVEELGFNQVDIAKICKMPNTTVRDACGMKPEDYIAVPAELRKAFYSRIIIMADGLGLRVERRGVKVDAVPLPTPQATEQKLPQQEESKSES